MANKIWKAKQAGDKVRPWDLLNPNIQPVSKAVFNQRYAMCLKCPELIKATKQCKKCGCLMNKKATLPHAFCPLNKWKAVEAITDDNTENAKRRNLVQLAVHNGGKLRPLVIPASVTGGTGLMNPSPFLDDDGEILLILRHINYTLYHAENNQRFPSIWGPLSYLHPEEDQRLVTTNYLCRLDKDYNILNYTKIDTSKLDVKPIWTFVGEEDARLVKWNGKYYATGVRRDTTTNGQGRMELSELEIDKENWTAKEVSRVRIEAPVNKASYCEKNWMPILDRPFQYIKWSSPTEVVQASPDTTESTQLAVVEGIKAPVDQRGGSQVVKWGEYYIAITHEVVLYKNYLKQKDGTYRHRLCVWDKDFKLIGLSPESFSFLDGKIEFVCGAAVVDGKLAIGFGFQDNAAFILELPAEVVDTLIEEALDGQN